MSISDDRAKMIYDLYAMGRGMSYDQIAQRLNITRNSVASAVYKYRKKHGIVVPPRTRQPRVKKKRVVPILSIFRFTYAINGVQKGPLSVLFTFEYNVMSSREYVSLMDLRDYQCHYVVTNGRPFLYCGHSATKLYGYCTHHAAKISA